MIHIALSIFRPLFEAGDTKLSIVLLFRMEKEDCGVVAGLKSRAKAHSWGIIFTAVLLMAVIISNILMYNYLFQRLDEESQEIANLQIALNKGDLSAQVSVTGLYLII